MSSAALLLNACQAAPPPTPSAAPKPAAPAPTTAPAATAAPAGKTVKLNWWVLETYNRTQGLWDGIIKDYTVKYPGRSIDWVEIPFDDYPPKVLTGLAGGDVGDLLDVHPVVHNTFAMRGALQPLDEYLRDVGFPLSDITPAWRYQFWRGKYWSTPRTDNPFAIMYNRKMVQDAGLKDPYALFKDNKWDLQAFETMMQTLSKGEGSSKVYGTFIPSRSLRVQCVWIWGAGGDIWNRDETETLIAGPEATKAWQYIADWVKNKWAPTPAEANIPGGNLAFLGQRRLALIFTGIQFLIGGEDKYLPAEIQKEMHVVPMHNLWNGKREVRNATDAQAVYAKSKLKDEAFDVHKHVLSEDVQKRFITARWTAPLRKTWETADFWLKALNPQLEEVDSWNDAISNVRNFSHVPRFPEIDKIVQTSLDKVLLNQASAADAMKDAKVQIDTILKENAEEIKKAGL